MEKYIRTDKSRTDGWKDGRTLPIPLIADSLSGDWGSLAPLPSVHGLSLDSSLPGDIWQAGVARSTTNY